FAKNQYPTIFHTPDGEGIRGTVVCEGVEMIPEITVNELSQKLKSDDEFILLDVREHNELDYAKLTARRLEVTPMSQLARQGTKVLSDSAMSQDATIYVLCHHGNRSGQV